MLQRAVKQAEGNVLFLVPHNASDRAASAIALRTVRIDLSRPAVKAR